MPFVLDEELRKQAQEWAEKTAVEQGRPPKAPTRLDWPASEGAPEPA